MRFLKCIYHIQALFQKVSFKIIYGRCLDIKKSVTWRKRFNIMIGSSGKIEIGENCFFNNDCSLNANEIISIGSGSIFG